MPTKLNPMIFIAACAAAFTAGLIASEGGASADAAQQRNTSQDTVQPEQEPRDMTPEMKAFLDAATPGRHHRRLDPLIGQWKGTFTVRDAPDAPPMTADGTITREWILDGRFIREVVEAETEMGTLHALAFMGYNNIDGRYEVVWMENTSTAIHRKTGTYHPDEKVLHTHGGRRDPVSGHLVHMWGKLDMSDPDRHVYTGYSTDPDGRTYKALEGVVQRASQDQ